MASYFQNSSRTWKEIHPGVLVSDFHRYGTGGGASLFLLEPDAVLPEHGHPTGEHGYVVKGTGMFGAQSLSGGDAFWMNVDEKHEVRAVTRLMFVAISLPRTEL